MSTATTDDLGQVLVQRLRQETTLPGWLDGTIVLRATGGGSWTLRIEGGRPALAWGEADDPDTTVTATVGTLRDVAAGERSGVDAFLDGDLGVRGNLALSLRMSGMWDPPGRDPQLPVAGDVTANGLSTFYLEAGSGPPVVLLHGLGATNASMLPTLRALCAEYRVIAPDLPGFGDSDKPLRPLHAAFYARWLEGLLDTLGIERAHVVGNSMGGRVAIEMGLRQVDRVGRLVLLSPSPAFLRGRDHVRLVRLLRPELAALAAWMPRRYVIRTLRSLFAAPDRLSDDWYAAAADEFLRVYRTVRGRIAFFSAARQIYLEEPHEKPGGFWDRLPDLAPPSLFVWGAEDWLVPASFARHVEEALPSVKSVVLDDCGHVPQYEHPDQTHELVRGFLEASD